MKNARSNRMIQLLAVLGVLVGMLLAPSISRLINDQPMNPAAVGFVPNQPLTPAPTPAVDEVVERHLIWAAKETFEGLDPQLVPIHEFFAQARLGTRAFAEDALGFDSKWKLVTGYVGGGDEHRRYLVERFAARVFSPEALDQVVRYAVAAYLRHLEDVDAQLLVRLKADLEDVPSAGFLPGVDRQAIQSLLDGAIQNAIVAVEAEMPGTIGQELVGYVTGEVLTFAGVKLATSAGILGAGASSGALTFGAGLVVGMIIDAIVGWAYDELFDPAGELSREVDRTLVLLEDLILDGSGQEPGLFDRLIDYAASRAEARNEAIWSVVFP